MNQTNLVGCHSRVVLSLIGAAFSLACGSAVFAQSPTELLPTDLAMYDGMGKSAGASVDAIVLGVPGDDGTLGSSLGAAYVYRRSGSLWVLEQRLSAPDAAAYDEFGTAVAIDGSLVVVGAPFDDDKGTNAGAAYVFRRNATAWVMERKLLASDGAAMDGFGNAVALSGDTIVVGAYNDGNNSPMAGHGAAYVYRYNGSSWLEEGKLLASDRALGDRLGFAVSVSGDVAFVGAYLDQDFGAESGSAYVFRRSGSTWSQVQKLRASDGLSYSSFGYSVSVAGSVAVIGAFGDDSAGMNFGSAYVFRYNGSTWVEEDELFGSGLVNGSKFGWSVAVGRDAAGNDLAAVGACGTYGAAYLFRRVGGVWSEANRFAAADSGSNDNLGYAVDLTADTVVAGSPGHSHSVFGAGAGYTFLLGSGSPGCVTNADCNDSKPCTTDTCNAGTCSHANLPSGTACGSSSSTDCDAPDACDSAGNCVDRIDPAGTVCRSAVNACDVADTCSGTSKTCTDGKKANGTACDDGLFCNGADSCSAGACSVHVGNPCPGPDGDGNCAESCNEVSNNCTLADPDGSVCNDGLASTTDDRCSAGVCRGTQSLTCNDNNPCTVDSISGSLCVHSNVANGTACGSSTTTDCSNPDTCSNGVCVPNNDASGTACADDGNSCTNDVCDGAGACVHPPKPTGTACADDGRLCTLDICSAGVCVHQNKTNGTSCSDGNTCNGAETCQNGLCASGTPLSGCCGNSVCDAGEECTCLADCGAPPLSEVDCNDGYDNDCDGWVDCDDANCGSAPECDCLESRQRCTSGSQCCSGVCGRNGRCK